MYKTLKNLSFVEGISLLILLFVAMPIKYIVGEPLAVKLVGSIHGALFLVLVPYIVYIARKYKWSKSLLFFALISTTLPFGMFALEKKLKKVQ